MKTTIEEAKEEIHNKLVHNLQELLSKNYDAEKGFKKAISDAKDTKLKDFLKNQVVRHNHFATEIDKEIRLLNEHPIEKSNTEGNLHRAWMDLVSTFSKHNDETILEECLRGEKAAENEYEHKLEKGHFPPHIKDILKNQLQEIKDTLKKVKSLKDLASN